MDERDVTTPDDWVKRHEAMLRLTGRHPFNAEPPMEKLQAAGWITPASLQFVRNHGSVPKMSWEGHRLRCTSVPRPCDLTMDELASGKIGEVVTLAVTFICAGNRRKEQNMVKKTLAFSWGPAAVANSIWTGVRLCDVLAYLRIMKASNEHRYVHFEGPDGELPQGKTGSYGTSIDISWALDRERDVLLAFKQNGELLTPDHGFPLRTLLPGCIGGRMVKWLVKLSVSDKPSENHYHFFDNRVLPPHVDAELAASENWFYKPEYIINHMNVNAAMFEPRHNSFFSLGPWARTLKVCGYAYAGAGHMIVRAEISLDGGTSWEMADVTRPEDEIAAARGKDRYWCWAFWETEVDSNRLRECKEIACRAVDSSHNSQPAHLTWNLMGMCNNPIFRVKVHSMKDESGNDAVWFEHPTQPGRLTGGWMTEDAGKFHASSSSLAAPGRHGVAPNRQAAVAHSTAAGLPTARSSTGKLATSSQWNEGVPMEELQRHTSRAAGAWILVKNRVYDCSLFLDLHPGGAASILAAAGRDATEDFEALHSERAWAMLEDYFVGPAAPAQQSQHTAAVDTSGPSPPEFLSPRLWKQLTLMEKIAVSHDARIFRFALPSQSMRLGLPTGQHVFLRVKANSAIVMRPYTPLTGDDTPGHVDFLVKIYFRGVHPKFPDGGKMSQLLEALQIGDIIEVKGPFGEFRYTGMGQLEYLGEERHCRHISMIAGGTGITPCYQLASAILQSPSDSTRIRLLYANQTPEDILAREQLDRFAAEHPDRFRIWYTVDRVPKTESWAYSIGFVTQEMIQERLFPPAQDTVTLMCGPPAMIKFACIPNLLKAGHADNTFCSLEG